MSAVEKRHKFQPGNQYGKLGGRPPKPPDARLLEMLDRVTVQFEISRIMKYDIGHIDAAMKLPTTSAFQMAVMSIMKRAIEKQDADSLRFLLDYTIGKPKETLEIDDKRVREEREAEVNRIIDVVPHDKLAELVKLTEGGTENAEVVASDTTST